MPVQLAIGSRSGHRADYMKVLSALLPNSTEVRVPPSVWQLCFSREPLLFATLEDHGVAFFAIVAFRSLRRRRTAALFLRPGECFRRGRVKYIIKRWLFQMVASLPGTTILTILPFSVEPRFACIANNWIHDPQMWDVGSAGIERSPGSNAMCDALRDAADGREIVLALGGQSRIKGFGYFADLWCFSEKIRGKYLFCAAGLVGPECAAASLRLRAAGALVFDVSLTNSELLNLYGEAAVIWTCYAPVYDQASGIFGRALQFGVPAAVRSGSYIEKIAVEFEHEHLALPYDDPTRAEALFLRWKPIRADMSRSRARSLAIRARSKKVLEAALSVAAELGPE